jgi:hypothetical protein
LRGRPTVKNFSSIIKFKTTSGCVSCHSSGTGGLRPPEFKKSLGVSLEDFEDIGDVVLGVLNIDKLIYRPSARRFLAKL